MATQERKTRSKTTAKTTEAQSTEEVAKDKSHQDLKDELDALLDEVDLVLEENAAEFVASYVQKGGQ